MLIFLQLTNFLYARGIGDSTCISSCGFCPPVSAFPETLCTIYWYFPHMVLRKLLLELLTLYLQLANFTVLFCQIGDSLISLHYVF